MQKLYLLLSFSVSLVWVTISNAQIETLSFEEDLSLLDTFINGLDGTTSLNKEPIEFPIVYDFDNNFWSGQWAVSTVTDSITPNFTNLYGTRAGRGANGSSVFLVGQAPFGAERLQFTSISPITLQSVQLVNSTYAYFVIRDGNQFSKAFGGLSGDDPDYFFIRWTGYLQGQVTDSLDIYLADYRFSDNSQDYILKEWTPFNLETLGTVDRVEIEFFSSDTGQFGINTPLFFNLDHLSFMRASGADRIADRQAIDLYPNPTDAYLRWSGNLEVKHLRIYNSAGHLVTEQKTLTDHQIQIAQLSAGQYYFVAQTSKGVVQSTFIKQ